MKHGCPVSDTRPSESARQGLDVSIKSNQVTSPGPPLFMKRKSTKTFAEERDSFRDTPRIFWESPHAYPTQPFEGILSEGEDESRLRSNSDAADPAFQREGTLPIRGARWLPRTGFLLLDRPGHVN